VNKHLGRLLLLLAALIWGGSFIFQSLALNYLEVYSINAARYLLACLLFIPFILRKQNKSVLIGGLLLGLCLGIGSNMQLLAMQYVNVNKASFLTALYILLVPILNFIFFKKNINRYQILALLIAALGLYFLYNGELILELADILLFICATLYAFQIILMEHYVEGVNVLQLCFYQYLFAGLCALLPALLFEHTTLVNLLAASLPLAYIVFFATGLAYTFQALGQKSVSSIDATLLMSLEAPFASIFALIFLKQQLSLMEILGCILLFGATLLCQYEGGKKNGSTNMSPTA